MVALWVIAQTTQATEQWLESLFGDLYKRVFFDLGYVLESAAGSLKKNYEGPGPSRKSSSRGGVFVFNMF